MARPVATSFGEELQQYVRTKGIQANLFNPDRAFYFKGNTREETLLQLAGLVCSAVGKIFCSSQADPRAKELFDALHSRMSVEYFPYHQKALFLLSEKNSETDQEIALVNLSLVEEFLRSNHLRTQQDYLRLTNYLLLYNRIDNTRLISTYEIARYLQQFFSEVTKDKVRLMVRNLRYESLFIISHSGKVGISLLPITIILRSTLTILAST